MRSRSHIRIDASVPLQCDDALDQRCHMPERDFSGVGFANGAGNLPSLNLLKADTTKNRLRNAAVKIGSAVAAFGAGNK
jgi:hypothetical protein